MAADVFPGAAGFTQLVEWGYPFRGNTRRFKPTILAVIHQTGNSRLPSAQDEIGWRLNDPALQNSATFFVDRTGPAYQCLLPSTQAPWSNGDVNQPDLSHPLIVEALSQGWSNMNEWCDTTIENVAHDRPGFLPVAPLTDAQVETNAQIIAWRSRVTGIPINATTVIGHYRINSVDRPYCPAVDKTVMARIITRAQQIFSGGTSTLPDTAAEEDDMYDWVTLIRYELPRQGIVSQGATARKAPSHTAPLHYTFMTGATAAAMVDRTVEIVGVVMDAPGYPPGLWFVCRRQRPIGSVSALFLVAGSQMDNDDGPLTGSTTVVVEGHTDQELADARTAALAEGRAAGIDSTFDQFETWAGQMPTRP